MRRSLTLNDTIRFQGLPLHFVPLLVAIAPAYGRVEKWLGKRLACFRKLASETLALPNTSKVRNFLTAFFQCLETLPQRFL